MNDAVLLLGTNVGSRERALQQARLMIEKQAGTILLQSHIYNTEPWGNTNQASFLNQAMMIGTALSAQRLLERLLQIEVEMGRLRKDKWEPRLIDIDILFFNEEVIHTNTLTVPHPLLQERRFALVPLNEILPSFIHPVFKCSANEMLKSCIDPQQVKLYI